MSEMVAGNDILCFYCETFDIGSRHQILTTKVDPRTVRVKIFILYCIVYFYYSDMYKQIQ